MSMSVHSNESEILLELLKEIRAEQGITQEQLAKKLRVHQSFVSKYESGERRIDLVELRQVCSALGVSLAVIIKRWESKIQ
jgi:transcriptional regulator with XRE-family HTH domain